jgi:hypothetical protein
MATGGTGFLLKTYESQVAVLYSQCQVFYVSEMRCDAENRLRLVDNSLRDGTISVYIVLRGLPTLS